MTTSLRCSYCKTILKKPQRCPCKNAMYCNRECQKKHWKVHKKQFHIKTEEKKTTTVKEDNFWGMAVGMEAGDHLTQVLFHYKGSVYPSSPDFPSTFTSSEEAKKFVREMMKFAKRMIHQGEVKEGLDKKSQVSLYIGQLDHIENTLREWEAHGHTPKDFNVFAKQKCHSDSEAKLLSECNWALNIMALIELGKLRDDDMNGPQILTLSKSWDVLKKYEKISNI